MLRPATLASLAFMLLLQAVCASPASIPAEFDPLHPVKRYDHNSIGSTESSTLDDEKAARYATVVAIHAVCGFLAFQVFMPLAVVFAAVGKSWFPDHWFRAHWKAQVFVVIPFAIIALILAFAAVGINPDRSGKTEMDKHKIMGFSLVGVLVLQGLFGYYSHAVQVVKERFAAENGLPEPPPKRRLSNWIHMSIGIALLTLGGLQVTWGFSEYAEHVGRDVPTWIEVCHYVIAGVPVLIVTPFILIRGLMRMRDGQSFASAFFSAPARPTTKFTPPPRKLFLGTSTYIDETYGPSGVVFDEEEAEKEGVGHEYAMGKGADGRQRVDSIASSWVGHATREEYEADVLSQRTGGSVVGSVASYDYGQYDGGSHDGHAQRYDDGTEEGSSLLATAAPMGQSTSLSPVSTTLPPRPSSDQLDRSSPLTVPGTTYPPPSSLTPLTSTSFASPPPSLPPMSPVFHSTSPSPSTLIASATVPPSPSFPPPPPSTFSPRLSFMPFPGPDAVPPPSTPQSSISTLSTHHLTPHSSLSSRPPLSPVIEVRDPPAGEGENHSSPATLVPSPPPPAPSGTPVLRSQPSAVSVLSATTSREAACGGGEGMGGEAEKGQEERQGEGESPTVQRHASLSAHVEGAPPPILSSDPRLSVLSLASTAEVQSASKTDAGSPLPPPLPLPSQPNPEAVNLDVPLSAYPRPSGGGKGDEEEYDSDGGSTRLFDELERELTISTMRSGRSARVVKEGTAEEAAEGERESAEGTDEGDADDAKTVASGVWLGGGK